MNSLMAWKPGDKPPRHSNLVLCWFRQSIEICDEQERQVHFWVYYYKEGEWHNTEGDTEAAPDAWCDFEDIINPQDSGLIIIINVKERPDQVGHARKVDVKVRAFGLATDAEGAYADHFRPLIQQMLDSKLIEGSRGHNRGN